MAEPAYEVDLTGEMKRYHPPKEVKVIDYRPTQEFKDAVQDVLNRRANMTYSDVIPLSVAIDNECARRGIIR